MDWLPWQVTLKLIDWLIDYCNGRPEPDCLPAPRVKRLGTTSHEGVHHDAKDCTPWSSWLWKLNHDGKGRLKWWGSSFAFLIPTQLNSERLPGSRVSFTVASKGEALHWMVKELTAIYTSLCCSGLQGHHSQQ